MFDFLKRPEPVELVEVTGPNVTFRSKKSHPEGKVLRIRFELTDGEKKREFKLAVMVLSCRPHTDKKFVCQSQVLETRSLSAIYHATQQGLNQAAEGQGAARRKARLPARLRVVSHGIHALSKDFNADGMQLEVHEPVEVGTQLVLTVELQTTLFPMLLVPAKVVWCREVGRRAHLIGIQFQELAPALQYQLSEYESYLKQADDGDIAMRTVNTYDMHLRKIYPKVVAGVPADPANPLPDDQLKEATKNY